ncbi:unnamed protein product [Allacma fusca]|uniref:C2 domain-containing protein n=1 Tax=Allacma fusca TaxID=39272 RepID=A0A8J2K4W8_9HEXA|nr:unnamed protein product [Allacma fusca]
MLGFSDLSISILLLGLVGLTWGQNIKIKLSARDLAPGDAIWGPPDPYVKVGYAIGSNSFVNIGKTSVQHTHNPVWDQTFDFQYVEVLDQRLQFEVVEDDLFFDDKYGTVHISTADILFAPGKVLERNFGKGVLIIQNVA